MVHTPAAIYARADNNQDLKAQVIRLKQSIRNDGYTLSKNGIYTDTGQSANGLYALLKDVGTVKIRVLYLDNNFISENDRMLIKEAVRKLCSPSLCAVVCPET